MFPLNNEYQVPFWMKKARFVLISTFPEAIKEVWEGRLRSTSIRNLQGVIDAAIWMHCAAAMNQ